MEMVQNWAQLAWGFASAFGPAEWTVIFLGILAFQGTVILRRLSRQSDSGIRREFAEVNTRLNMLIFELRQIRGAYGESEQAAAAQQQYDAQAHYSVAAE